jgi:hypothetical protein
MAERACEREVGELLNPRIYRAFEGAILVVVFLIRFELLSELEAFVAEFAICTIESAW